MIDGCVRQPDREAARAESIDAPLVRAMAAINRGDVAARCPADSAFLEVAPAEAMA